MKIRDIICETGDHIKTYWAIKGFNLGYYFDAYEKFSNDTNTFRGRNNLLQLSSFVHTLLVDEAWSNLESDPDFDRVYDGLLDLYDKIQARIRK